MELPYDQTHVGYLDGNAVLSTKFYFLGAKNNGTSPHFANIGDATFIGPDNIYLPAFDLWSRFRLVCSPPIKAPLYPFYSKVKSSGGERVGL